MDYVDTQSGKRHAKASSGRRGETVETWCGSNVIASRTGACIPAFIDCGNCKREMRKEGYEV